MSRTIRRFFLFLFILLGLSLIAEVRADAQSSFTLNDDPENNSEAREPKSPKGAMLRSALIPGWGQIYNRKLIFAPILIIFDKKWNYQVIL